ncbi:MAG: YegS/Rv2252/BmrU family lipid kinase [Oscillospiraceae bacterium]|nr:YegS/Rv2252/BmrU family lipid kinase [Oscillospiraceae bacterium]
MMLLVNPNAGKGQYKNILADVLNIFCAGDILPTVYYTRYPGNSSELVRDHASDYDIVGCIGGDGTLSEVVSGMIHLKEQRPIGYIPLGTANDVAKTLGLDVKEPLKNARRIVAGKTVSYDVGQFGTDDYFTYIAAFGAFTEVSYATPQELKQTLGHLAYMLEGAKRIPKISNYRAIIEHDNGVIRDDFIFGAITNSTSVAGLVKLNSDNVGLSDGMFEVLLVKTPQSVKALSDIATGILSNNFDQQNVVFLKSREIRIMFEKPTAWTRDGEDGGVHQDVFIVNRHPGVEIFV